MRVIHYVNLTTGVELLHELALEAPVRFVRLQSSHLEGGHWQRFVDSVPDDMLFYLARGHEIVIHDAGSRSTDGVSRVIWQGIPYLRYFISFGLLLPTPRVQVKRHDVTNEAARAVVGLDLRRVKYHRRWVNADEVRLRGSSRPSELDGRAEQLPVLRATLQARGI